VSRSSGLAGSEEESHRQRQAGQILSVGMRDKILD
jgi:hypothetical protein